MAASSSAPVGIASMPVQIASTAPEAREYRAIRVDCIDHLLAGQLKLVFSEYGEMLDMRVFKTSQDERNHYAVITYATSRAARTAVREAKGLFVNQSPSLMVTCWPQTLPAPEAGQSQSSPGSAASSRGLMIFGWEYSMVSVDIYSHAYRFGEIEDIVLDFDGRRPQQRQNSATIVFDTAYQAEKFARSDFGDRGYRFLRFLPSTDLVQYEKHTNRTIYLGNVPDEVTDGAIYQHLHAEYGFVSQMTRLRYENDRKYHVKVRFANPAVAAKALQGMNQNQNQFFREHQVVTRATFVEMQQSLPERPWGVVLRKYRRMDSDGRPRDEVIARSGAPGYEKRIRISGLNITSAEREELVFEIIRFYDQPGTDYQILRIRFISDDEAIVAFKMNDAAIVAFNRMDGETFGGPSEVQLSLIG